MARMRSKNPKPENNIEEKESLGKIIFDWVKIILVAVGLAIVIDFFIIVNSIVPSGSMEPTIMTGSRMIGFRLTYLFEEPQRGDIIIFKYPDDESQTFVKRIVGMPGDTVEIKAGVTYINGEVYEETWLAETPAQLDYGPYVVPEDSYFVMGDNRNQSNDARFWTNKYVAKDKILGKALFVYWPLDKIGALK